MDILSDPRRRQRAAKLLDIIEQKKTNTYKTFLEAIEDQYPHIYLALVDWEDGDDDLLPDEVEAGSPCKYMRISLCISSRITRSGRLTLHEEQFLEN